MLVVKNLLNQARVIKHADASTYAYINIYIYIDVDIDTEICLENLESEIVMSLI